MKTHYFQQGIDHRNNGQTNFEYEHTTLCCAVRHNITTDKNKVDCIKCLEALKTIIAKNPIIQSIEQSPPNYGFHIDYIDFLGNHDSTYIESENIENAVGFFNEYYINGDIIKIEKDK